ncbi:DEAD/DEAH box helicase [Aquipuribacter sp. SD81]|uniref:DEAD/DEAH box helicase n=1 Tax=Aquipuribacter sp. SD81 TaxID=3127703 RepID=UPI003FA60A54
MTDLTTSDTGPAGATETLETTAAKVPTPQTFADFGVQPEICEALAGAGITHPFPIQAMTLPVALGGADIIGQAKTGTGKTLGFGVPLVQRVVGPGEPGFDDLAVPGAPQALVVAPTRELALQVAQDLTTAASRRPVRVTVIFGGRAYEPQIEALRRGVEIVVGTPGRLIDLANQGHLDLGNARHVVLDEADEMLDLGFLPDVERILSRTPAGRQTMLFSATMPSAVVSLARQYMTQPTHIRAHDPDDDGATVKLVTQFAYRTHPMDRIECLARLLQAEGRGLTIVFTRTRRNASKVADDLVTRGFAAAAIHGDLGQGAREQALRAFRNGKVDVLIATDVAARGIDVTDVTHVVNYECPDDARTYVHRIGRTGRAGKGGTAVTFVEWADTVRWQVIAREIGIPADEPVETYSTSPHLYTDLGIPEGTKGRLPRAARTRAGLDAEEYEDVEGPAKAGRGRSRGGRDGGREGGRDGGREGGRDGGREGGRGRDGGRGRRSGGGPSEPSAASDEGVEVPRTPRRRRRGSSETVVVDGGGAASGDGTGSAEGGSGGTRRRRRRRGSGQGAASGSSGSPVTTG